MINSKVLPHIENQIKSHYNKKNQELNLTDLQQQQNISMCKEILKARDWAFLKVFIFCNCLDHGDEMLKILKKYQWPNLIQIHLSNNNITYEGIKELACLRLPQLRYIDLNNNQLKQNGSQVLFAKFKSTKMTHIMLKYNKINHKGLRPVLINKELVLKNVKVLHLSHNPIGFQGINILLKLPMAQLCQLDLQDVKIGDKSVKKLIKANWPHLQFLNISQNNITGLITPLLALLNFPALLHLHIGLDKPQKNIKDKRPIVEIFNWSVILTGWPKYCLSQSKLFYDNLDIPTIWMKQRYFAIKQKYQGFKGYVTKCFYGPSFKTFNRD